MDWNFVFAFTLGFFARAAWADEALTARNKDVVRNFYTTVCLMTLTVFPGPGLAHVDDDRVVVADHI